MSTTKTLKLINTLTTQTTASHRRRSSAAMTAATFVPMFQQNVQTSLFPHCQLPQGHQLQQFAASGTAMSSSNPAGSNGLNGQQYQQFLPAFVTPTTPASSDHQTSYHGTNVTSPPPYYFNTPPISSVGGAGASALVDSSRNGGSGASRPNQHTTRSNTTGHSGNHAPSHSHHKRNSSLHQDMLNKKHGARSGSVSQFSVAGSPHFQFAFEAQYQVQNHNLPQTQQSAAISGLNINTNNFGLYQNNINSATYSNIAAQGNYSRQHSLQQVQNFGEVPQSCQQNSGFPFLALNPEPISLPNNCAQAAVQPQVSPTAQLKPPSQGLLPGGFFFSLTPEDSYPPLCVSAQPSTTFPESQPNNPYLSVMPLNPVVQQVAPARAAFPTGYMRPVHQRLTRNAVAGVDSRDSREFRWNRVLRYVHEVSAPHGASFPPSDTWIRQQRLRVLTSPRDDSKEERQSLWDGGSLGTNGVDDFIWDDDLQNGKRFTIPPKSQQGDPLGEDDNLMFNLESSKTDFDLAFGYEVDDSHFHPPAKRSKSNESQKAARRGLHEYLAALKSFELSHVQDMKREAPLTMA